MNLKSCRYLEIRTKTVSELSDSMRTGPLAQIIPNELTVPGAVVIVIVVLIIALWRSGKLGGLSRLSLRHGESKVDAEFFDHSAHEKEIQHQDRDFSGLGKNATVPPDQLPILTARIPPLLAGEEKANARASIEIDDERSQLSQAAEMFKSGNLLAAKRIFDAVQQRHPQCAEAILGGAQILRRQNDLRHAILRFGDVIRSDPRDGLAEIARKELREIRLDFRARKRTDALIELLRAEKSSAAIFCFPHLPDPVILGRHLCALSNGNGGSIIVGIDSDGRGSGSDLNEDFAPILEAAWLTHCEPPCFFEMLISRNPNVIVIEVDSGPAKPYLVRLGDESSAWLCDRSGTLRLASPAELKRLKGIVRP